MKSLILSALLAHGHFLEFIKGLWRPLVNLDQSNCYHLEAYSELCHVSLMEPFCGSS